MRGFEQLEAYKQLDVYWKWLRQNRDNITEDLAEEYARFRERPVSDVVRGTDFPASVGLPMFFLSLLLIACAKTTYWWIVVVAVAAFGFWLHAYQKYVAEIACRHFFEEKRKNVLYDYVDRCKAAELEQAATQEEIADINDFYEYCRQEICFEDFRYYEKRKFSRRRKN